MPFKSQSQRRWMFAAESRGELRKGTAREWAHHTPDIKKLPERVGEKTKEGIDMSAVIAGFAREAADDRMVEKLASDTKITPDLVRHLASQVNMTPNRFVKEAYADPAGYTIFLKVASGAMPISGLTKGAGMGNNFLKSLVSAMRSGKNAVGTAAKNATGKPGAPGTTQGGYTGQSSATGNRFDRAMSKGPIGGSRLGRNVQAAGGASAVGAGGAMAMPPSKPQAGAPEQAGQHEQTVNSQIGGAQNAGVGAGSSGGGGGGGGSSPAAMNGPAPNPKPAGGGGLSPAGKGLVAAGGVGLGALGVGALARRRKQQKKEVTAADVAKDVMRQVIIKKAADMMRKEAADKFVRYLDGVAGKMSLEKMAHVRKIQAAVAEGKPLSHAIKLAYPHLNGEQRGILASRMVKAACSVKTAKDNKPFFKGKTVGRQETSVKMKDGAVGKMKQMSGSC